MISPIKTELTRTALQCVRLSFLTVAGLLSALHSGHAQSANREPKNDKPVLSDTHHPPDEGIGEYQAIANVLQKYLDAARSGNGTSQRPIWFDHAHIVGSEDGRFENTDADTFAQELTQGGPAPTVVARVTDIAVSGPAAYARIEIQGWAGFRYTDFFLLYKHNNVWQVSGKVFDSHNRN